MENLINLLGEKNTEQFKKDIYEILLDRVRGDLDTWGNYDFNDIISEIYKECKEEIKPIIKSKILEEAMSKLKLDINITTK